MPRYKITVEYDGTPFAGWQVQEDQPSVQGALQEALKRYAQVETDLVAAGRTDAGVHALGQVAHFDLPAARSDYSVREGLNQHLLPHPIAVLNAEQVADDFHARFSATSRRYIYRILSRPSRSPLLETRVWHVHEPLREEAMHQAAQLLVGQHDFSSFRASICQAKSPVKTLDSLNVSREGDEIRIEARARSFLHNQVRVMVGSLYLIGIGKWQERDLLAALEAKDRRAGGPTAPPCGLYLAEVTY